MLNTVNLRPGTDETYFRYPKPGTPNPLVTVHTFSLKSYSSSHLLSEAKKTLSWPDELPEADRVIDAVSWVSDDGLLLKEVDRASRVGRVVLFQGGADEGIVVRKLGIDGEEGDNGWIDHVGLCLSASVFGTNGTAGSRCEATEWRGRGIPRHRAKRGIQPSRSFLSSRLWYADLAHRRQLGSHQYRGY